MTLPILHFRANHLHPDEAFERWRALIAPMYGVDKARGANKPPMGEVTAFLLGDILANRTIFEAQHVSRDKKLVERTPDHLIFQYWRSGGYNGEISGKPIAYGGGHVRFVDCRRVLAGRFTHSDTLGFAVPRSLMEGIDADRVSTILDARRDRLAAAKITSLYRRLPQIEAADVSEATADLLAFMRRLFDPSPAADVLLGYELDESLLQLAEHTIALHLNSDAVTPDFLADQLGVSRATLYRLFTPFGGVMRYVGEQRLLAVSALLADPLERRSLTKLSEDYGFSNLAVFSRTFRTRFDVSPREWRREHAATSRKTAIAVAPLNVWWDRLGRERWPPAATQQ